MVDSGELGYVGGVGGEGGQKRFCTETTDDNSRVEKVCQQRHDWLI